MHWVIGLELNEFHDTVVGDQLQKSPLKHVGVL